MNTATNNTVAQSKRWFAPEVNCWITQEKVPATWEDAQRRCEIDGAVLASPLNTQLFNYMQSRINVNNHSTAYFIGIRAKRPVGGQEVDYVSVEGRRLEDLPMTVYDAIEQLDLEQGDCLSMDRHGISAVSCWDHLPYICYSNEATECGSALATTQASTTSESSTTTSTPPPTSTIRLASTSAASTTASTSTTTTSTLPPTTTIPPGYTYYPATGSYYKLHKRFETWYVAKTACVSEGGHLLVLNDAEEADIVARILKDANYYYGATWTGLQRNRPGGVMDWRTVHGEPLSNVYNVWGKGLPVNDERYTCGLFNAYYKLLYDYPCGTTAYYFTCEIS